MGLAIKKPKQTRPLASVINFKSNRTKQAITDLAPYKKILDQPGNPILLADGTFMDMLNLPGKDLDFLNKDGQNGALDILRDFHRLLTVYTPDFDIKVSQMPAETKKQQAAWATQLATIDNDLRQDNTQRQYNQLLMRRQWIIDEINYAKTHVASIRHQDYTIFLYAETLAELTRYRNKFIAESHMAFDPKPISLIRKKAILYQINNPGDNIKLEEK